MRKALFAVVVFVVLVVAAALIAPFVIDLNRYRDRIAALAKDKIGRDVKIGHIDLTVLTGLGAAIGGVEVGGTEAFPEPLLKVDEFRVRIALLPLFRGSVQIGEIALDKPEARIRRTADGAFSFDDIVARLKGGAEAEAAAAAAKSADAPGPAATAKPAAGSKSILAGLLVQKLRVDEGFVAYTDAALVPGKTLEAELLDVHVAADGFRFNEPVPIEASFRTPQHEAIALTGDVGPVPEDLDFNRAGFDLRLKGQGVRAHDWAVWAPKLPVQLHSGVFECDVTAKGSLTSPIATAGYLSFAKLALTDPKGAKVGPIDVRLDHDLTASLPDETATIRKATVRLGDLRVDAKGTASRWTSDPAFDLDVEVADVDVAKVLALHPAAAGAVPKGVKIAGVVGYGGKVAGSAASPGAKGTVRLAKLDVATGDLALTGATGTVAADFKKDGEALRVDADAKLQSARLAAAGATVEGPVAVQAKAAKAAKAWNVDARAVLDAAAVAFKDQFRKPAGTALQVDFRGRSAGDRLDVDAARLRLADATVDAKGAVESLKSQALRLDVETSDLDLASLAASLPALAKFKPTGKVKVAPTRVVGSPKALDKLQLTGAATVRALGATAEGLPKPIRDLSADLRFTGPGVETKGATLALGDERLTVDAKVTGFAKPQVRYDVRAPRVDLAAWMPPAKDTGAKAAASKPGPRRVEDARVVGTADLGGGAPVVDARLTANKALFDKIEADGLDGQVRYANQSAKLEGFTFKAFQGAWKLAGDVNLADKDRPRWSVDQSVTGVDANGLLATFASVSDILFGSGNEAIRLSGAGFKTDEILGSVQGAGTIDVGAGRLEGVNLLAAVVDQVERRLGSIPGLASQAGLGSLKDYIPAEELNVRSTSFDRFFGDYAIGNRRVDFKTLSLVTNQWDSTLRGAVGFDKKLDLGGELVFSQKRSARLVEKNKNLRYLLDRDGRMHFPLGLTGSVTKPIPTLKLSDAYFQDVARRALEGLAAEQLERLFDRGKPKDEGKPRETKPGEQLLQDVGRDLLDQLLRGKGAAPAGDPQAGQTSLPSSTPPSAPAPAAPPSP